MVILFIRPHTALRCLPFLAQSRYRSFGFSVPPRPDFPPGGAGGAKNGQKDGKERAKGPFFFGTARRACERVLAPLVAPLSLDPDHTRLLATGLAAGCYGLGLLTLAGTVGVDTGPLATGLGVAGVAAGFAAKDVAANSLGGALLVLRKPFHTGDQVALRGALDGKGLEGVVESVDWQHVTLRSRNGGLVVVPSALMHSAAIEVLRDQADGGSSNLSGMGLPSTPRKLG